MTSALRSPDPEHLQILEMEVRDEAIVVHATTTSKGALCPLCQHSSERIHSHYVRTLADLPCSGLPVRWSIQVRRYKCLNTSCARKIFVERLHPGAPAYARRWLRQKSLLIQIAFALGGRPGERLLHHLGLSLSNDSLLRLLRAAPLPDIPSVRVLGVDDWAFRKGKTYGTILVDLETKTVLDLLPNREKESLIEWPGIEVVSRDRGGPYAEAARKAAPHAIQVADRYHLAHNLTETLERIMRRRFPDIQKLLIPAPAIPIDEDLPLKYHDAAREVTYQKKMATYEQVIALQQQGHNVSQIADHLRMGRQRVRQLLKGPPERTIHKHPSPKLGPWKSYLRSRFFEDGCRNSLNLYREIHSQGYDGGMTIVVNYVTKLRQHIGEPSTAGPVTRTQPTLTNDALPTPRQVAWWCYLPHERLREKQQEQLQKMRSHDGELNTAYELAQRFRSLLNQHASTGFDQWLQEALACDTAEIRSFARGLQRDEKAVRAGLDQSWSQGQVEAQVHRLKLIKRLSYGRAKFDLLRIRVLHPTRT